ncbi:MAG: thioredoxin [Candidatus Paceibacterota bacterium]
MNLLTDSNFMEFIKNSDKPVLVDIFTQWCPPCKMLAPVVEKVASDYKEKIVVAKIDLDASPIIGNKFGVEVIPTVILFKDGEVVDKFVGFKPEQEIKKWIDRKI